jgi:hypothetical protein
MKKLSKRARLQDALEKAATHVRMFGLSAVDDWAYTIAEECGLGDDDKAIQAVAEHMKKNFEERGQIQRVRPPNERGRHSMDGIREAMQLRAA